MGGKKLPESLPIISKPVITVTNATYSRKQNKTKRNETKMSHHQRTATMVVLITIRSLWLIYILVEMFTE